MIFAVSRAVVSAFVLFAAGLAASAQEFPTRPITIILPYPPGASTEQVARMLQPIMQERLKQPIVIENKPGGNGSIGTLAVARAAPDGYTILLTTNALMTIVPNVQTMPFDPLKDFAPLTTAIRGILGIAINPKVPANNVAEFIAYVKTNPKAVSLRHRRDRQPAAHGRPAAEPRGRHRSHSCAVQGRRAGRE